MSAYSNEIKSYMERYKTEVRADGLIDPHDVAVWAYEHGLHKPNIRQVIDLIANDISQALREEYRIDKNGLRYRAKHAVKERRGNKTMSLWADLDDASAPRSHFVKSFAQRRGQIVGDCVQLRIDVGVYNEKPSNELPINLVLNFTNDVEEHLLPFTVQLKKAA